MRVKNKVSLIIGLVIFLLFLFWSIFPSFFSPYSPKDTFEIWQGMSLNHIFGTNDLGYDIYTEIVYATKDTLIIALASALFTMTLALIFAFLSNLKKIGIIFDTIINILTIIPKMIAILVLISFLEKNTWNIIWLISFFSFGSEAKILKNKLVSLSKETFIEQNRLYGYNSLEIGVYSYLPNIKNTLIVRTLGVMGKAIMMESALSFLGMGDLYNPSWGTMINFAYQRGAFLMKAYNYLLAPSLMIMLLCLSFYLIGRSFEESV